MKTLIANMLLSVILLPVTAQAADGFDYQSGTYIEIEEGNLVEEGEEIEYFDYESREYRYGDVESVQPSDSGSGSEVEVYDPESGEYRTFEME